MSSLCMWLMRLKTLKSSLTSFYHNPHPIYEQIFSAAPSRDAIYRPYLSHLKYCHILPGQTAALASLKGLCLQTFPTVISSMYSSLRLFWLLLTLRTALQDLTCLPLAVSSTYYALITLAFLLLPPRAKHVPTSSPVQLPCSQPRTASPETQS